MILLAPQSIENFSQAVKGIGRESAWARQWEQRLRLLPRDDRVLVEMAMQHHMSRRQMGSVLGCSPGNVSRRLRRVTRRLADPLVGALISDAGSLADEYRQAGIQHFLLGTSVADLARARRISKAQAHGMIQYIRGWHRGVCGQSSITQAGPK